VKLNANISPSVLLEVGQKQQEAIERDQASRAFLLSKIRIYACEDEHTWNYPLTDKATWNPVNLPDLKSTVQYPIKTPVSVVAIHARTCLELNQEVGGKKLSKHRAAKPILHLGYKHLRMSFSVEVKKDPRNESINFTNHDCEPVLMKLSHQLPGMTATWMHKNVESGTVLSRTEEVSGFVEGRLSLQT